MRRTEEIEHKRDGGAQVLRLIPSDGACSTQTSSPASPPADGRGAGFDDAGALARMAAATARLARRNEALEDFAALVAHELKSPLEAALLAEDPRCWIASALDLVEMLLQAATESTDRAWSTLSDCLTAASCCLLPIKLRITDEDGIRFPLPSQSLAVILRNLLANAAAAQARQVDVFTAHRPGQWCLVVDDDGIGLGPRDDGYEHGSGIGLELCRRIAERNGGGTRAVLTMERAA